MKLIKLPRYKTNERGICPLCKNEELCYGSPKVEDNYLVYPWSCEKCGASGKEFYTVEFSTHGKVKTKSGIEVLNDDGY